MFSGLFKSRMTKSKVGNDIIIKKGGNTLTIELFSSEFIERINRFYEQRNNSKSYNPNN